MTKLTRNFSLEELACHDGTPVPAEFRKNALEVCKRAQALRNVTGPLIVTSGYRTRPYNKRVGGVKGSQHLTASALDLCSREFTPAQLADKYLELVHAGVIPDGGLGVYPGWIHIDTGRARRWTGPKENP